MLAKDIMTTEVISVTAGMSLEEVAQILVDKHISGVPVLDDDKHLIGIISEGDLVYQQKPATAPVFFQLLGGIIQIDKKGFWEEMKKIAASGVDDLMTTTLITAKADANINELATLMIQKRINRIPIIDEDNHLLGMVTRHDIIKNVYL